MERMADGSGRRRQIALWIGAACVAAMGFILGRTAWSLLIVLLPADRVPAAWGVALISFGWLAGCLAGWWAVAKWAGAVGLCPSRSGWRRRGMELGVVVGVVTAMWLCIVAIQMLAMARMRASAWDAREIPPEVFTDPETGEPLAAHTETINFRAGFDLPRGDAAAARMAWRLAAADAGEAPELPENPDDPESQPGEE